MQLAPGPDGGTGGSYQFSGNDNSFIEFPNNGGLDTRYSLTFLAWIYHEQEKGSIFYFAQQGFGFGVRFLINENDRFSAILRRSDNFTMIKTTTSKILEPRTWHFVGTTFNFTSGEFRIWLNGSKENEKWIEEPVEISTQLNVIMGAFSGNFKGRISCVQLYDRVLTEQEIDETKNLCSAIGMGLTNLTKTIVGFHTTSPKLKLKNYRSYRDFTFTMH